MPPLPLPDPPLVDPAAAIVLRPWGAPGDAAALAAAWADPEVARYSAVPADRTTEAAARWIAGEAERRRRALALDLVIAPAAAPGDEGRRRGPAVGPVTAAGDTQGGGGQPVLGEVGLARFDAQGRAEVGFWLAPEARGRGVATAAVRLLAAWALAPGHPGTSDGLGLRQVWARTPANTAAAGVFTRAGFERLGEAGGTTVWAARPAMLPP